MLFGDEHVQRYRETGGEEGHDWQGTSCLLLTTKGRKSGEERTAPLIYGKSGDDYLIVASKGGADEPPAWYLNIEADPEVELQVRVGLAPHIRLVTIDGAGSETLLLRRLDLVPAGPSATAH